MPDARDCQENHRECDDVQGTDDGVCRSCPMAPAGRRTYSHVVPALDREGAGTVAGLIFGGEEASADGP